MITNDSFYKENYIKSIQMYTDYFTLKSLGETFPVYINFCMTNSFQENQIIESILHDDEMEYFKSLKYERRINSFLLGRYASKKAVSALIGEKNLKKISIKNGVFNQPVIVCESRNKVHVSITHCGDLGAAVAFSDLLLIGIDIESIGSCKKETFERVLTQNEKTLVHKIPYSYEEFLAMVWTIKESLSKVLKTGLTIPFSVLEVVDIEIYNEYCISIFKNFTQYKCISFAIRSFICSITFPKNMEILMDINGMKANISKMINL